MTDQDSAHGTTATSPSGTDPRLHRLLILSDGVYAIALTPPGGVELGRAHSTRDLRGVALLTALLESWPKVLAPPSPGVPLCIFIHPATRRLWRSCPAVFRSSPRGFKEAIYARCQIWTSANIPPTGVDQ